MTSDEIDAEIENLELQLDELAEQTASSYEDIIDKELKIKQLSKKLKDLICVLEVEHFLEAGPLGKDPE